MSTPQPTADELFDLIQDLHAQREKADQMRAAEGVPDAGVLNGWERRIEGPMSQALGADHYDVKAFKSATHSTTMIPFMASITAS